MEIFQKQDLDLQRTRKILRKESTMPPKSMERRFLDMKFKMGEHINLQGFTSSSQVKEKGIEFALLDIKAPQN